jgi:hypothetical protein
MLTFHYSHSSFGDMSQFRIMVINSISDMGSALRPILDAFEDPHQ